VRTLLDDRYAPITSDIGFLELPLERATNGLLAWVRANNRSADDIALVEPFPEVLHRLEPLCSGPRTRQLFVETRGPWTAYFDNGYQGGDPTTVIGYLSRTVSCRGVTARAVPRTIDLFKGRCGRHGSLEFQLFGARETEFLNYVRTIYLTHDGRRWQFGASGEMQPYEMPERYRARHKTDRFTSEMLEMYCRALGIELFDTSFYGPRAVLVTTPLTAAKDVPHPSVFELEGARVRMSSVPIQVEELSLAEVQRRHCIGPGTDKMLAAKRGESKR
jgi:hypothetical protein